jgi:hypothetical protein
MLDEGFANLMMYTDILYHENTYHSTNLTSAGSVAFIQVFYYYHKASERIFETGSPHQKPLCLRFFIYAGPIPRWPHEVKILAAMTPRISSKGLEAPSFGISDYSNKSKE